MAVSVSSIEVMVTRQRVFKSRGYCGNIDAMWILGIIKQILISKFICKITKHSMFNHHTVCGYTRRATWLYDS